MNSQEIFDKVSRHLLTQGERSMMPVDTVDGRDSICAYRGECGKMCAVGVLIDDAAYTDLLEGKAVNDAFVVAALRASGVEDGTSPLLQELQAVHDAVPSRYWGEALSSIAEKFDLSHAALEEFEFPYVRPAKLLRDSQE